jgi:DNA-binding XRE family transcriptional regulator
VAGQTFAARLKQLREEAGLTQRELAERAGMHLLGVAKLEQGLRQPTWATVETLARALGVNCMAFEGTSGPAEPPPARPRGRPRKGAGPAPSGEPPAGEGGPAKGKGRGKKRG